MADPRWPGDVLERHESGDFLYALIQKKHESTRFPGSISCAVDGDWGAGKTFFVDHFSRDLEGRNHAVIRFDAWKNDLSDDPLIGFIAEIKKGLIPYIRKAGPHAKRKRLVQHTKEFLRRAGHAIVPATFATAKGIAGKFIGDEAANMLSDSLTAERSDDDTVKQSAEKAIEAFFETTLKAHSSKREAITQLTQQLESLANAFAEEKVLNLPIYICIDELDRCRPTYAIALLESTKHLLDAKGICFVFSTNLTQLTESIKAVYGSGFDAHMYLKRFFDFQYNIPTPDNSSFAKYLVSTCILNSVRLISGIPKLEENHFDRFAPIEEVVAPLSTIFNLDLRSQKQIFDMAEAAAIAIPKTEAIHFGYLFTLAILLHRSPKEYINIAFKKVTSLDKYLAQQNLSDYQFSYEYHNIDGYLQRKTDSYSEIFEIYLKIGQTRRETLAQLERNRDFIGYLVNAINRTSSASSLINYPKLVWQAGQIA